jgi:protoporphyrinogen oxidase
LRGLDAVVFEADDVVGGIARTVRSDGYRFDLGGHRFFTKLRPIERIWEETLGEELLTRPRLSRVYYQGKFFAYPLAPRDVVRRLGIVESARCALSYLWSRHRVKNPETFEDWVTARFGKRLYDVFFRSYTEKVWGIAGSEIRAEWAAQRIKNFSLGAIVRSILGMKGEHVTTLIEEFRYPRLGPGQMWETLTEQVERRGIPVNLGHRCMTIRHDGERVQSIVVEADGRRHEHEVDAVLSSIPLSELALSLDPPPPPAVAGAARGLRYRSLCLVALMTTEASPFPDNWIYLHDPGTRAGRVQNFGAWSEGMVRPGTSCLGVEYFCFEGDEIWELSEHEVVELAKDELASIGLIDPAKVVRGLRVRVPKAYPMYDATYRENVDTVREHIERLQNLKTFGRNGLHRYNNQDHSMWTAILATLEVVDGTSHDVWSVNTEAEYHEEGELVEALLGLDSGLDFATDLRALAPSRASTPGSPPVGNAQPR